MWGSKKVTFMRPDVDDGLGGLAMKNGEGEDSDLDSDDDDNANAKKGKRRAKAAATTATATNRTGSTSSRCTRTETLAAARRTASMRGECLVISAIISAIIYKINKYILPA